MQRRNNRIELPNAGEESNNFPDITTPFYWPSLSFHPVSHIRHAPNQPNFNRSTLSSSSGNAASHVHQTTHIPSSTALINFFRQLYILLDERPRPILFNSDEQLLQSRLRVTLNDKQKKMIEDIVTRLFNNLSSNLSPSQSVKILTKILSKELTGREIEAMSEDVQVSIKQIWNITKEAEVNYIQELIQKEIKRYQNKAAATMQSWYKRIRDENSPVIPDEIVCPITGQIFSDPVEIPNKVEKIIVERKAIEQWIKKEGTDPFTRKKLTIEDLKPAPETLKKVEDFFEKSKESPFIHLSKYSRYKKEEIKLETAIQPAQPIDPTPDDLLAINRALGYLHNDDQHSSNLNVTQIDFDVLPQIRNSNILFQSPPRGQSQGRSGFQHIQENAISTSPISLLTNSYMGMFSRLNHNRRQPHATQSDAQNANLADSLRRRPA